MSNKSVKKNGGKNAPITSSIAQASGVTNDSSRVFSPQSRAQSESKAPVSILKNSFDSLKKDNDPKIKGGIEVPKAPDLKGKDACDGQKVSTKKIEDKDNQEVVKTGNDVFGASIKERGRESSKRGINDALKALGSKTVDEELKYPSTKVKSLFEVKIPRDADDDGILPVARVKSLVEGAYSKNKNATLPGTKYAKQGHEKPRNSPPKEKDDEGKLPKSKSFGKLAKDEKLRSSPSKVVKEGAEKAKDSPPKVTKEGNDDQKIPKSNIKTSSASKTTKEGDGEDQASSELAKIKPETNKVKEGDEESLLNNKLLQTKNSVEGLWKDKDQKPEETQTEDLIAPSCSYTNNSAELQIASDESDDGGSFYNYKYSPKKTKSIRFINQVRVFEFNGPNTLCETCVPLKKEIEQQFRNKEMRKIKGQESIYLF